MKYLAQNLVNVPKDMCKGFLHEHAQQRISKLFIRIRNYLGPD